MADVITLQDLKDHLRILTDAEDAYLAGLIETATAYVEGDLDASFTDMESTPAGIPLPLKQALLFLCAHWYEERQPVTSGVAVSQPIPLAYESIINKYRNYSFA
jgi:uncharacterized phage protein (predicted DNA packaging)